MSLVEDVITDFTPNALVGAVLVLALPVLYPLTRNTLRPLAKGAIKGYFTVEQKVKEWTAESSERLSDLVAEARAEHAAGPVIVGTGTTQEARAEHDVSPIIVDTSTVHDDLSKGIYPEDEGPKKVRKKSSGLD